MSNPLVDVERAIIYLVKGKKPKKIKKVKK